MKIALIGYGKMGKMVERAALAKGHQIAVKIDPKCPHTRISKEILVGVDLCIDFTRPSCALDNLQRLADLGKSVVMGTTGWYSNLDHAKQIVASSGIGFLYAPNFSLGIALFLKMVAQAAQTVAPFSAYDVSGLEIHHQQKADSPSGTAKALSEQITAHLPRKQDSFSFASVRVGSEPGTHTIIFDSPVDTITLTHQSRSREGFAEGAVQAAEWLQGKKGFFTLNDLLEGK